MDSERVPFELRVASTDVSGNDDGGRTNWPSDWLRLQKFERDFIVGGAVG